MKRTKKITKFQLIIWPIIYLVIVLVMCFSGVLAFHTFYYRSIFVQGPSMQPTLNNDYALTGRKDFGLVDTSEGALRRLKRFDIVITYFPWLDYEGKSDNPETYIHGTDLISSVDYKIKRLVALPGETVQITSSYDIVITTVDGETLIYDMDKDEEGETENLRLPYNRKKDEGSTIAKRVGTWVVGEDGYFLMGDNWNVSEDCSLHYPVFYENLVGRLVCIEGTCRVDAKGNIVDKSYVAPRPY